VVQTLRGGVRHKQTTCRPHELISIVNRPDAAVSLIYLFWFNTLHISEGLSVHHQEFKTVHTATGICQTAAATCLLAGTRWNSFRYQAGSSRCLTNKYICETGASGWFAVATHYDARTDERQTHKLIFPYEWNTYHKHVIWKNNTRNVTRTVTTTEFLSVCLSARIWAKLVARARLPYLLFHCSVTLFMVYLTTQEQVRQHTVRRVLEQLVHNWNNVAGNSHGLIWRTGEFATRGWRNPWHT
jgi:hypothetical protein